MTNKSHSNYHSTWRWGKTKKNQTFLLFLSVYTIFSSSMSWTPIEEPNRAVETYECELSNEIKHIKKLNQTLGLKWAQNGGYSVLHKFVSCSTSSTSRHLFLYFNYFILITYDLRRCLWKELALTFVLFMITGYKLYGYVRFKNLLFYYFENNIPRECAFLAM